ncbi:formylglycine-generating enzyme family protein [Aromatoleum petrolei]|uniref:SUMF1/EgtB/PvdO family nonheme iron enzyme n=1 Tax=Aromatoleum petrolei TaxID=76116 RepID=A0ABX1MP26_9RHOO|nr:formylglycine-generating enzyme family protein [Aromatoleum petrolei]NMF88441.1 SUMF1/EgtB/PvdO family nonheme iron enzyme [Aromatoleum petrolei]
MRPLTATTAALLFAAGMTSTALHAADAGKPRTWTDPKSGLEFVRVGKACFRMGNDAQLPPEDENGWARVKYKESLSADEAPAHEACLDTYWLGRHEVTRRQWQQVMGSLPDGNAEGADNLPVTRVTWEQARAFTERLSAMNGKRHRFRLPTEAEWEFACRGASPTSLDRDVPANETELQEIAVADIRAPVAPATVGSRKPNAAGFHDLLGNVWEWTADDYAANAYARHSLYNPRHSAGSDTAVIRGGSVRTEFVQTRCTMRGHYPKSDTLRLIGLRIVRED